MDLRTLLSESPAAAERREAGEFGRLAGDPSRPLVLVGAGRLGLKVLRTLRRHGIEPLAFADRDAARWGGSPLEGLPVYHPAAAAARFGSEALFVVTIFRGEGDGGMAERIRALADLGCRRVTTFLPLAWRFSEELLPHYGAERPSVILAAAAALTAVGAAWHDEASRREFLAQLLWRLRGDFSAQGVPCPRQYFPPDVVEPRPDERFVDGGAYDGDTLRALGGRFARAWAIEPSPAGAAKIRALGDGRITVVEAALGAAPGESFFSDGDGPASRLSAAGGLRVRVETLDSLLAADQPSFLKLDIEGGEQGALSGASGMLARCQPVVAACVYHRPDDLWTIPLFLARALPRHRLFLRAHQNDGYELVAYAVPPERCGP